MTPQRAYSRSRSQSDLPTPALGFPRPVLYPVPLNHNSCLGNPYNELIAEVNIAHIMGVGKFGVACAGGAASGPPSYSLPKESIDYAPIDHHPSPRELGGARWYAALRDYLT